MTVAGTTPYPWPYDGRLDPTRTALIICGSGQEWSARTPLDHRAEQAIMTLRRVAATTGTMTLLVRHQRPSSRPTGPGPAARSPSPVLDPTDREREIRAAGIDGFYGSDLDAVLHHNGRSHLLVAGRGLETTVHSTLRRANDRGYECLTVADACAAIEPDLRPASLSTIEMSGGIFGAVGSMVAVGEALGASLTPRPTPTPTREERA